MADTTYRNKLQILGSEDEKQLVVRGHSAQSIPLQEWQDSSGTPLAWVSETGEFHGGNFSDLTNHLSDTDNPHDVTASQLGLGTSANAEFATLKLDAGSVSVPALHLNNDSNTGIYHAGADILGISAGGNDIAQFGSAFVVINDTGADRDFRIEGDTDANLIYVDASTDRVGLGISAPLAKLHVTGSEYLDHHSDSNDAAIVRFRRSRGSSGSPSAVQAFDLLGRVQFYGYDGNSYEIGGEMSFDPIQNWDNSNRGSALRFSVIPVGSTSLVNILAITGNAAYFGGDPQPMATNTYNLGNPSFVWENIYSHNAVTVTSDEATKDDIKQLPKLSSLGFVKALMPKEYKLKGSKDQKKRVGFIAQDVAAALDGMGVSSRDYSVYVEEEVDGKLYYGIRYSELIPFAFAAIQELSDRIDQLQGGE